MFRAYEPEQDRLVAVKVFHLDLPPERVHQLVAEFEGLIASDVTHPSIAAPLAAGISGASAYLAQDFVAADSADIVLRDRGRVPHGEAARVALQLAAALDAGAAAGIVHGALHPRDVLMTADDARLTGLGVARALERVGVTTAVRRPYTAPERAEGRAWDRRADIFSLAAVVYEMILGKRLTATGAGASKFPSVAGADSTALGAAFARALADDPGARFESAVAFAEAVKDAARSRPQGADRTARARPAVPPVLPVDEGRPSGQELRLPLHGDSEPDLARPSPEPVEVHTSAGVVPVVIRAIEPAPETVLDLPMADPAASLEQVDLGEAIPTLPPAGMSAGRDDAQQPGWWSAGAWPLALAVAIGLAVGFAGGFALGSRARQPETLAAAAPVAALAPATPESAPRASTDIIVGGPASKPGPDAASRPRATVQPSSPPSRQPSAPAPAAAQRPSLVRQQTLAGAPARPVSEPGRILVRSIPAGAAVTVNGRSLGSTPVTMREVERGEHTVRVSRTGYETQELRVSVTSAQPAQSLTIELEPLRGAVTPSAVTAQAPAASGNQGGGLYVESRPPGASVFVDGRLIGTTPLAFDGIDAGDHAVRLEREGYRLWSSSVRIVAGQRHRVAASLER